MEDFRFIQQTGSPLGGSDISSQYGCYVPPVTDEPVAHSSSWLSEGASVCPDEIDEAHQMMLCEYQAITENNPYDEDVEMLYALANNPELLRAGYPGPSHETDSSLFNDMLPPESCGPNEIKFFSEEQDLQALMPAELNLNLQRGPQYQPALIRPGSSQRPYSRVASLRGFEPFDVMSCPDHLLKEFVVSSELGETPSPIHTPAPTNRKKLFGNDGWLGPVNSADFDPPVRKSALWKGLSKRIKQQISDIVSAHEACQKPETDHPMKSPSHPFTNTSTRVPKVNLPTSLSPGSQAKLYADLEVMICSSANGFLLQQYYDGRISQHSIDKVNSFWGSKNRPQVTEFHFDQETQRSLIMDNRRTVVLRGDCATSPTQFHSNMQNWKSVAQEMSVRTFCLPDSVIRKHLYDIHSILDMLNAPVNALRDFRDLSFGAHSKMVEGLKMKRSHSQSQMSA